MSSAKLKKIMADDKAHLFQNYGDRMPVCFVRGEDSYLFDQDNKKYIDFFSGIAVSSLGHRQQGPLEGAAPPGRQRPPHLQLVLQQGADRGGSAPDRGVLSRQDALRQQRHRGERGGHQAGAPVRPEPGKEQVPDHQLHELVPRQDLRRHVGDRAEEDTRRASARSCRASPTFPSTTRRRSRKR